MVRGFGKALTSTGTVKCSLPALAISAAAFAIALGVVITPWIGLPLRSVLQSYIRETDFRAFGRNAEVVVDDDNKLLKLANNSMTPGYSPGPTGKKGRRDTPDRDHEEIPREWTTELKRKELNRGMDQDKAANPFALDSNRSAMISPILQPEEKQFQSNGSQAAPKFLGNSQEKSSSPAGDHGTEQVASSPPTGSSNSSTTMIPAVQPAGKCDLFHGKWVHDSSGPLYKNDSCPVLTQAQNCQGNGRPDKDYEYWKWQPLSCELPRFDAHKFLQIMHGKTLAFVGDSVARNQMESLMCILWQVETPKNKGNRKMQKWLFHSHSVTIIRIWSAWLVHTSNEAFQFAPAGIPKLHLDIVDETFMDILPTFDVLVVSSGHWFAKKSAYLLNSTVVGGQLWWEKGYQRKVDNTAAFITATETALKGIVSHPNYTGLTIFRTYSPDHYEGGAWNTGGSCTGKVRPFTDDEVPLNVFTEMMRTHQLQAYEKAKSSLKNKSKIKLLDITPIFEYRADGHPGPYRSQDPNKITKRGPDGRPPPQDCLHWCMPGPVDTWNEFVFELVRRHISGIDDT